MKNNTFISKWKLETVRSINKKWEVVENGDPATAQIVLGFRPVQREDGSEYESFHLYTPCGSLEMTITNPKLLHKFEVGEIYSGLFELTGFQ